MALEVCSTRQREAVPRPRKHKSSCSTPDGERKKHNGGGSRSNSHINSRVELPIPTPLHHLRVGRPEPPAWACLVCPCVRGRAHRAKDVALAKLSRVAASYGPATSTTKPFSTQLTFPV